jgi:hypothetical protein
VESPGRNISTSVEVRFLWLDSFTFLVSGSTLGASKKIGIT